MSEQEHLLEPAQPAVVKAAPEPAPSSTKADTSYLVLSYDDNGNHAWTVEGSVAARDPEAAIKAHVEKLSDKEGTFVAVNERYWKPVTTQVEVVTTTTINLKAAKS